MSVVWEINNKSFRQKDATNVQNVEISAFYEVY